MTQRPSQPVDEARRRQIEEAQRVEDRRLRAEAARGFRTAEEQLARSRDGAP